MLQLRMLKICLLFVFALLPVVGMSRAMAAKGIPEEGIMLPMATSQGTSWPTRPMNESEFTSAMCVLGATAMMAATYMAGPNEIIMLIVGGVIVPSTPTILFISLFGTMAAAGCTIGALGTPAVSWMYRQYNDGR